MKYKAIVVISVLVLLFNVGLAQLSQQMIDKKAMHPRKPGAADVLTITNDFYDLIVENFPTYGVGTYTVSTGDSHPATIAMGNKQNVLYGGASASPWSTYLSVKSYTSRTIYHTGSSYYTPDTLCSTMQLDWTLTSITQPTPTSILCVWDVIGENDFLTIKQNTFIDGTTLDDSKIGVTTTVKNTGYDTVRIGIRYEWDIMIDGWDGSAMREKNPQGPWLYSETTWTSFNYTHYEITDSIPTPTFYNLGSVTGPSYLIPSPTPPDKVQFASWPYSYDYAFNYTTTGQYLYGTGGSNDSDILYYWGDNPTNAIVLAPGDSVMVTQYLFASLLTINYQVDNLIKNSTDMSYIGDNIYNLTGVNQTKSQTVAPNSTAIYHVKIENDGTGQDGFNVQEVVSDNTDVGWNVQYFDALTGGNNITAQVTSAGWSTGGLNPGQFREIRVEVTPDMTVPSGSSRYADLLSTSQNDNSKRDVVRTITTASVYHDVGMIAIIAPVDTISEGTLVTPRVVINNFGNQAEQFVRVYMSFGAYTQVQSVSINIGATDTIDFPEWTAGPVAFYQTYANTQLPGDENPSNDSINGWFVVVSSGIHDVGANQIISPIGSITAGEVITPLTIVQNFGDFTETFDVVLEFSGYGDTQTVSNLAPGAIDTVEFDPWTAVAGSYLERSFTMLTGDQNTSNDTTYMEFSVTGQVIHDVGATMILAPLGSIQSGTVVTPRAIVHNFGNENETGVPVYFAFGTYSSMRTVSLVIGATDTVDFDNWTAVDGNYNTIAYTALVDDINLSNDSVYGEFTVYTPEIHDVGITVILAPTGTITHGSSVIPRAKVKNFNLSTSETFYARFKIGDVYNQIILVSNLSRGEEREIEFPGWTTTGCVYVVSCSTELALDQNTSNDKMTGIVDVLPVGREIQTNWVSGPGVTGPVSHWGLAFDQSDSINYNITGQISLIATGTGGSDALWTKHIIETTTSIDGHNGIFPADFDGDGDLDLAGAIDGLNQVRIYRNQKVETGTVDYIAQVSLARSIGADCLLWCGDFDRDGDADIVVPGPTEVGWYENTGNFNFTYHTISGVSHSSPCCDVGDIDNDGDNDVIVGDAPLDLYRNNGAMTFARTNISGGVWWRVKLGDLNNDNYLDLLNSDRVYLNNNGNFPSVANWIAPLAGTDGHWIRDFDNDGINDLLLADASTDAIYWYKNDGTGSAYTQYTVCPAPSGQYYGDACIAEDIDLDGKADVVGTYSRVGFFKQVTPTNFQEIIVDSSFSGSHWCYTANLDYQPGGTDFDLDILASSSNSFAWWDNPTAGLIFANYGQLTSSVIQIPNVYTWKCLNWYGNRPANTDLKFYVRSGVTDSAIHLNPWCGPFDVSSGQPAGSFNVTGYTTTGDRFFQYKVEMVGGGTQSPVVYEVSVDYDTITAVVHHDVGVSAIIEPTDTLVTCNSYLPIVDIINNTSPQQVEVCTVDVNIWHYQVKMDSLCHISCNLLDSVLVYTASLEVSVNPEHNSVAMITSWHPAWSDIYWVNGHHVIYASVRMTGDENPDNNLLRETFIVKARDHDLQMNYVGLLRDNIVVQGDTIGADFTYNTVSIVSNSPAGPEADFRAWFKVIRVKDGALVYSRHLDRTIGPNTYACLYYQTGWSPTDSGWYKVRSWIETRPDVDLIADNNSMERLFYARLSGGGNVMSNVGVPPTSFALLQNYPNPFSGMTSIRWQIPIASRVTISIYDATGRNIKTLAKDRFDAGYYTTTWDCTNDNNQKVAAGIYFYELRSSDYTARHKMIITH